MKTSRYDTSYIHIKIEPNPELSVKARDLMREVTQLVRERVDGAAEVTGLATLNPRYRDIINHGGDQA